MAMIDTKLLRDLAVLHRAMEGHTRAALLDAAADEIDALRADRDAHRDEALKEAAAFDAANAAVARLRAALTQIAANSVEDEWERFGDPHASMLDAVRIARAALGDGT